MIIPNIWKNKIPNHQPNMYGHSIEYQQDVAMIRNDEFNKYIYKVRLLRIRFGYPELDFGILVYLHNILFTTHLHRFI